MAHPHEQVPDPGVRPGVGRVQAHHLARVLEGERVVCEREGQVSRAVEVLVGRSGVGSGELLQDVDGVPQSVMPRVDRLQAEQRVDARRIQHAQPLQHAQGVIEAPAAQVGLGEEVASLEVRRLAAEAPLQAGGLAAQAPRPLPEADDPPPRLAGDGSLRGRVAAPVQHAPPQLERLRVLLLLLEPQGEGLGEPRVVGLGDERRLELDRRLGVEGVVREDLREQEVAFAPRAAEPAELDPGRDRPVPVLGGPVVLTEADHVALLARLEPHEDLVFGLDTAPLGVVAVTHREVDDALVDPGVLGVPA